MENKLIIIFSDQLSESITSLKGFNKKTDIILMQESYADATYVKHHKKKLGFMFACMRHFALMLKQNGYKIIYIKLDDVESKDDLETLVPKYINKYKISQILITHPCEYRTLQAVNNLKNKLNISVTIKDDDRFLCGIQEFKDFVKNKKNITMEPFYRHMRKKHNILMQGDKPILNTWNFDASNRKPAKQSLRIPKPLIFEPDEITTSAIDMVNKHFNDHFGDMSPFYFAVTKEQAQKVLAKFIEERLCLFGDYQDAMLENQPWMFHSHISFYLNCGLLLPDECIQAAIKAYNLNQAPINAVEGFIRQILGWREYVRGIYWLKMPEYAKLNFLQAKHNLPEFFWNANTKMNCIKQCVTQTKKYAYAHHIQRLMVLGNFALISGLNPDEVNMWYLIVYADAYEWVELPNVTGMILFADGGFLGTKPYAASGSYINKMSDYCKNCQYKVKEKTGKDACPFNYLFWNFLQVNKNKLINNPRLSMMYKTLAKFSKDKLNEISNDSIKFLDSIKPKV